MPLSGPQRYAYLCFKTKSENAAYTKISLNYKGVSKQNVSGFSFCLEKKLFFGYCCCCCFKKKTTTE